MKTVLMRAAVCAIAALACMPVTVQAQGGGQRGANSSMRRLGWRLGAQAYTFREMSLMETIDVLKGIGLRNVELYPGQRLSKEKPEGFSHNSPAEAVDEVIAKLRDARIRAVAYGVVGLGADEKENRKVFDFAKKMGMTVITAEPSEAALPAIDKLCTEYKIKVAIHNHPKPSHYWSPEVVLNATKGLSENVGSCADTGHWYRSGLVPVDCLKQLKGRIASFHFKDLVVKDNDKVDAPWGTGLCAAEDMLKEIKAQGFKGPFSIEYESTTGAELIANVTKCVKWFNDMAEKLAPPAEARP